MERADRPRRVPQQPFVWAAHPPPRYWVVRTGVPQPLPDGAEPPRRPQHPWGTAWAQPQRRPTATPSAAQSQPRADPGLPLPGGQHWEPGVAPSHRGTKPEDPTLGAALVILSLLPPNPLGARGHFFPWRPLVLRGPLPQGNTGSSPGGGGGGRDTLSPCNAGSQGRPLPLRGGGSPGDHTPEQLPEESLLLQRA